MTKSKFILTAFIFALMGMTLMTSCVKEEPKPNLDPLPLVCDPGYEGVNCDKLIRDQMLGNYDAADTSINHGASYSYNPVIAANGSITAVSIFNFGDFFGGTEIVVANVTRSGDIINFTIAAQKPDDVYSVSGSGTYSISNRKITIQYTLLDSFGMSDTFKGIWIKL